MSRGRGGAAGAGASRGGWGGGRGGGGAGAKQRIGGQEVSWDYDPDLVVETKPQEMFPRISLPQQRPPTTHELLSLHHTLTLRRRIRTSPLYTTPSNHPTSLRLSKARAAADFNPFEDMPTYTQKYHVGVRKPPGFKETGRRYQLRFFPGELWETLEPGSGKHLKPIVVPKGGKAGVDGRTLTGSGGPATSAVDGTGTTSKPAMPPSSSANASAQAKDPAAGADEDAEDPTTAGAEENNAADADDDEDEGNEEENLEEDFSEDDSDMGGDYNAENYFDAGEDDVDLGDNEDGGGGMDYD